MSSFSNLFKEKQMQYQGQLSRHIVLIVDASTIWLTKCKKGFKINQNRCYKYVATKMNFFEAEMFCRTQRSSLTDIRDANEEQWIRKLTEDPQIWTSGSDLAEHGEWKWLSSGLPMTFTNWTKGEPENNQERCLCFHKPTAWHDCGCSEKFAFICKY